MSENDSICVICHGCDQYNDGTGTQQCLECEKMNKQLPSMLRGRKRMAYVDHYNRIDSGAYVENFDDRIDAIDRVSKLSSKQVGVLCDVSQGKTWGQIGKDRGMHRANARRTFKRAMRRLIDGQGSDNRKD